MTSVRSWLPAFLDPLESDLRAELDTVVYNSLRPASLGLGILYSVVALSHILLLPPVAVVPMTVVAALSAVSLFLLWGLLARRSLPLSWASPLGAGIAAVVVTNCLLPLALLPEPHHTTSLMFVVMGAGCLFLSAGWFICIIGTTFAGWSIIGWTAPPSPAWIHSGLTLFMATLLSVFIYYTRLQTYLRLGRLRKQDAHQQQQVATALTLAEQARQSAEESEVRFRSLIRDLHVGVLLQGPRAEVLLANQAATALFGVTETQLLATVPFPPEGRVRCEDGTPLALAQYPVFQARETRQPVRNVVIRVDRLLQNDQVWLLVTAEPQFEADGSVHQVLCSFSDITARKEIEQLKDELISAVNHEFCTPLASLRGYTELLLEREFPPHKQREIFSILQTEALRLARLVNDFLTLQRLESGRQTSQFTEVALGPLVQEGVTVFAGKDGKHTWQVDLPEALPLVYADADRIRIVLSHLLANAVKFSPHGGTITAGACTQGTEVKLWISDRGIGIPPERIPQLFEKFFRVENTDIRNTGGIGLGLALVKKIIEEHHGKIWAESTLNEGSTFFFTLPIALHNTGSVILQ